MTAVRSVASKNRGVLLIILIAWTLCGGCRANSDLSESGQAERFVQALNRADVQAMLDVSRVPFAFRTQEWASAPDGSGFVLGRTTDKIARNTEELRALFSDLPKTVRIAKTTAVAKPPAQEDLIQQHVQSMASRWATLRIVVFLRGAGDVEHTALVGVEPSNRKVAAFYVN